MYTGNDLINVGLVPGKYFAELLNFLNTNNTPAEQILTVAKPFLPPPVVNPYLEPLHYIKNIEANTDAELENLISVEATMAEVMVTPTVVKAAVMPDACPAGSIGHIPVGGVVVTNNAIHPAMHSADICCSVMLTGFGKIAPKRILDVMHKITDFGAGPRKHKHKFDLPEELYAEMQANRFFGVRALAMAKSHLGTQGDGNHFAFVGVSKQTGETCLVTHHGSRGVGAQLYKAGMQCAEKWRKRLSPATNKINAWIPYNTEDGAKYWQALQLVRKWTKLNHQVLHHYVRDKVRYISKFHFWNEHNFVFKQGDNFYHAKGSTPLTDSFVPDNTTGLRIIPLNMAQPILIVKGEETITNLGFAPHGAGRNMSRTQFLKQEHNWQEQIKGLDVRFYTGQADYSEYPAAYKNAEQVKQQIQQFGLGHIVDEIIPYGCIMAGKPIHL